MIAKIAKTKKPAAKKYSGPKCRFQFSDTRSCSMPRLRRHKMYCVFHAHQAQQLLDADRIGKELTSFTGEFRTATDLNRALGNLFKAVAQNRIPPKNAAVLAYIGQLLCQTIPKSQEEITSVEGEDAVENLIRGTLDLAAEEYGTNEEEEAVEEEEAESDEEQHDEKSDDNKQEAETQKPAAETAKPDAAGSPAPATQDHAEDQAIVPAAANEHQPAAPIIAETPPKLPAPYPPPNPNAFAQYHHLMELREQRQGPVRRRPNRWGSGSSWSG
jgi:chemotaxis protein histidine kinase CheA